MSHGPCGLAGASCLASDEGAMPGVAADEGAMPGVAADEGATPGVAAAEGTETATPMSASTVTAAPMSARTVIAGAATYPCRLLPAVMPIAPLPCGVVNRADTSLDASRPSSGSRHRSDREVTVGQVEPFWSPSVDRWSPEVRQTSRWSQRTPRPRPPTGSTAQR